MIHASVLHFLVDIERACRIKNLLEEVLAWLHSCMIIVIKVVLQQIVIHVEHEEQFLNARVTDDKMLR